MCCGGAGGATPGLLPLRPSWGVTCLSLHPPSLLLQCSPLPTTQSYILTHWYNNPSHCTLKHKHPVTSQGAIYAMKCNMGSTSSNTLQCRHRPVKSIPESKKKNLKYPLRHKVMNVHTDFCPVIPLGAETMT